MPAAIRPMLPIDRRTRTATCCARRLTTRRLPRLTSFIITPTVLLLAGCLHHAAGGGGAPEPTSEASWRPVADALGRPGTLSGGTVYRVSFPRTDLTVTVAGVPVAPALALGGWVAFARMGSGAMMMGDLVLTPDEVAPVMLRLQQGGIEQTALHNHLAGEEPRVMYMHVRGRGDPVQLARVVQAALAFSRTPLGAAPSAAPLTAPALDTAQLNTTLGGSARVSGGVLQYSFPRAEAIQESGMTIPPAMGVATGINLEPLDGGRAATTGDFVLVASEVNPVMRALRESGITVTAVHNHMLTEEPRLFFLHFWGVDDASRLAQGLRAALDKTNVRR